MLSSLKYYLQTFKRTKAEKDKSSKKWTLWDANTGYKRKRQKTSLSSWGEENKTCINEVTGKCICPFQCVTSEKSRILSCLILCLRKIIILRDSYKIKMDNFSLC